MIDLNESEHTNTELTGLAQVLESQVVSSQDEQGCALEELNML